MSIASRELAEVLSRIEEHMTLSAAAFREMQHSRVLDSGTRKFNGAGVIELGNFQVPYAAVTVFSNSGQKVTIANRPNEGAAPTEGVGVKILNGYNMGTFNMVGRALTFYGNPGDTVTYEVFAKPQPPAAMAGSLAFISAGSVSITGTAQVAGTVTAQTPATSDLYTEAATSRTTNGNTATLTFPAQIADVFVGINVTGFAGGTNVVISLQQQDANGIFQTIASSAALTATGVANFSAGPGTANGALLRSGGSYRLAWTVTGTFTTLTFQLGVTGR